MGPGLWVRHWRSCHRRSRFSRPRGSLFMRHRPLTPSVTNFHGDSSQDGRWAAVQCPCLGKTYPSHPAGGRGFTACLVNPRLVPTLCPSPATFSSPPRIPQKGRRACEGREGGLTEREHS